MSRILSTILFALSVAVNVFAGDTLADKPLRPVMSAYMLQAGSSHLADTYLSPLKFSGWNVGFTYERMQAMKFSPEKWVMQLKFGVSADNAKNVVNADMWYWGLNFSWGMMRRWREVFTRGLTLGIGGSANLEAGCVYNSRNGNNPASAKASITVGATGYAAYNMKIGRLPVTLRYQATLPVTGVFFAPDYGELYYEIYLGNHSGLAHAAWWGNYFKLDNLVTADLHLGSTSLRLGYAGSILSTNINHTVTHIFTHAAILGISGEWLSLNPRKQLSPHARMISSLF